MIINFAPDHYNGFFYKLMPPFCIGYAAESIGDYGSQAGRLDVPEDLARALAESVIGDGIDLADVAATCRSTTAPCSPMEIVYGDITAKPFIPVFINSVAPPFTPIAAGPAARRGHRPPPRRPWTRRSCSSPPAACPTTRPCRGSPRPPPRSGRMLMGGGRTALPEAREARQQRVIDAARDFAAGRPTIQDLAPEWDRELLEILASGDLTPLDAWTPD